jgi:Icc-related predicted phosphoesterase
MTKRAATIRIAAVGDLHCTTQSRGAFHELFIGASREADVIALCGDLTDYGLPDEAQILAGELAAAEVPVVGVLGNHDHESDQPDEVARILTAAGMKVLDGDAVLIGDVGFAGTKGFAGGFGRHALGAWGELAIKAFVQAALDEALKLETGLARLRSPTKVALLHYSPIQGTVEGEPEAIFPFLGSERLEEPLDRYEVSAVFHGHAHHGAAQGTTRSGTPVYNVCLPLLRRESEPRWYRLVELPAPPMDETDRELAPAPDRAIAAPAPAKQP